MGARQGLAKLRTVGHCQRCRRCILGWGWKQLGEYLIFGGVSNQLDRHQQLRRSFCMGWWLWLFFWANPMFPVSWSSAMLVCLGFAKLCPCDTAISYCRLIRLHYAWAKRNVAWNKRLSCGTYLWCISSCSFFSVFLEKRMIWFSLYPMPLFCDGSRSCRGC